MLKSRAIDIIKTFSSDELKQFSRFTLSPYYNRNKNLVELFNIVRVNFTRLDKISEETIFEKLFPGKKYNYGIMKNLLSELYSLCEKFLIAESSSFTPENTFDDRLRLLAAYNHRFLDKIFMEGYKELEQSPKYSILESSYFTKKSRLASLLHEYYSLRSRYPDAKYTLYPRSIYNACQMISTLANDVSGMDYLRNQINFEPKPDAAESLYRNIDIKNLLNDLKGLDDIYFRHIELELKLMALYTEPDNYGNYSELKEIIISNLPSYSNSDRWHLTSALINFLLNGYIKGKSGNITGISEIRKLQLDSVKFNAEGMGPMQAGTFRNIVEVFMILKDYEYAEKFIASHADDLEKDKREGVYNYCMAILESSKNNHEKVLLHINKVDRIDYQTKFSAKMLGLISYYELDLIETGLSAVDAMKHFIKDTDEFSAAMKKNLGERVSMIEKLFKINANPEKYSSRDIDELHTKIEKFIVSRKEWYLQKADELRKLVS